MLFDNIPQELKKLRIWGVSNKDKIPFKPHINNGYVTGAKTNDINTWGSLDDALKLIGKSAKWGNNEVDITYLSMLVTEPYIFIDLDHVINSSGEICPSALDIVNNLDSYTEVSQSGTGLHIITKCDNIDLKKYKKQKGIPLEVGNWVQTDEKRPELEIYQKNRHLVFTNNVYLGKNDLTDDLEGFNWLVNKYLNNNVKNENRGKKSTKYIPYITIDSNVEKKANEICSVLEKDKKIGNKFKKLYIDGDTSMYGDDDSSADMALCSMIAYHTDDSRVIDCIVKRSAIYRDKWDREDYKKRTITKAIDSLKRASKMPLDRNERGTILHTKENVQKVLNILDIDVRFNVLEQDICVETKEGRLDSEEVLITIYSYCKSMNFNISKIDLRDYIYYLAKERPYNPFRDYLLHCEQEYTPNTQELEKLKNLLTYDLQIDDVKEVERVKNLYDTLIDKFLISIVALNIDDDFHKDKSPQIEGSLILKGGQGIGKTTLLSRLVPSEYFKEGAVLRDSKDTKIELYKYILVELGELETTTKKEASGFLKNELTRQSIEYRPPYGRSVVKFARRTAFCGSVNEDCFLKDSTGSRRFWIIPVKDIDLDTHININQLWAEVITLYRLGFVWFLSSDERKLLNDLNKEYQDTNYLGMILENTFDFSETDESKYLYAKSSSILQLIKDDVSNFTTQNMIAKE